jgi:hypothetical protein
MAVSSSSAVHLGPIPTAVIFCVIGTVALLIGLAQYRNTQIFDNVSMRPRPVDPENPTRREQSADQVGQFVGCAFVLGGGLFAVVGLVSLIVHLI